MRKRILFALVVIGLVTLGAALIVYFRSMHYDWQRSMPGDYASASISVTGNGEGTVVRAPDGDSLFQYLALLARRPTPAEVAHRPDQEATAASVVFYSTESSPVLSADLLWAVGADGRHSVVVGNPGGFRKIYITDAEYQEINGAFAKALRRKTDKR
jgi:hypothetical protein